MLVESVLIKLVDRPVVSTKGGSRETPFPQLLLRRMGFYLVGQAPGASALEQVDGDLADVLVGSTLSVPMGFPATRAGLDKADRGSIVRSRGDRARSMMARSSARAAVWEHPETTAH